MEQQSSASEEESSSSSSSSSLAYIRRVIEEEKEVNDLSRTRESEKKANLISHHKICEDPVSSRETQEKIKAAQINEFVARCKQFLEAKGFSLEPNTASRLHQIIRDRYQEITTIKCPTQRNQQITLLFNDFLRESLNISLVKTTISTGKYPEQKEHSTSISKERTSSERMTLEEERKHTEPATMRAGGLLAEGSYLTTCKKVEKAGPSANQTNQHFEIEVQNESDCEESNQVKDQVKTDKTTAHAVSAGDSKKLGKKLEKLEEILDNYIIKLDIKNDEVRQMCSGLLKTIAPQIQVEFRNKPFEAVVASILLAACSQLNYPITIKEVVNIASDVKGKTLTKIIHKCIFVVKGYLLKGEEFKIYQPEELVRKIAEKIDLHLFASYPKCEAVCKIIIESLRLKNLIMGRHSSTIAAYALLLSCFLNGIKINLNQRAQAANINKIT